MADKDKSKKRSKIIELRNSASLMLDDLIYEVVNSSLAAKLRDMNRDLMSLDPGFAFTVSQAEKVKDRTESMLNDYRDEKAGEYEIMDYIDGVRSIMRGEAEEDGGRKVGLFGKIFVSKEEKAKEALEKQKKTVLELESACRKTSAQMEECESRMKAAVAACKDVPPDSAKFREYQRAYMTANDQHKLLRGKYEKLDNAITTARRAVTWMEENQANGELAKLIGDAIGDQDKLQEEILRRQIQDEMEREKLGSAQSITEDLFTAKSGYTLADDNEFTRAVANARRQSDSIAAATAGGMSEAEIEFAKLVGEQQEKENV